MKSGKWIAGLMLALAAPAASAQSILGNWGPSTHMGEPGGEAPKTLTCPDWYEATGIQVRSGWYIHGIRLECASINVDGIPRDPVLVGGNIGGTTGGTTRMLRCNDGEALVGFRGREGWWIDRIEIACKTYLGGSSETTGSVQWRSAAGGTGGEAYGPVLCPGRYAVYSLTGARTTNIVHGELVIWYAFSCRGRK